VFRRNYFFQFSFKKVLPNQKEYISLHPAIETTVLVLRGF
jgi:hypothetical protein